MKNTALVALAKGFLDGGSKFSSNFPGFYSQQLHSLLGGKSISIDEKSAYAEAFGASFGGTRSVCSIKNVGLNIASDPFLSSLISGVNAGLVLVVTDDMQMWGSQHRQDTRHYRDFYGGLWLEPDNLQHAYDLAYHSHEWSELLDIPIVIRLTNQFFKLEGNFKSKPKKKNTKIQYKKNPKKFIVHPMYWKEQSSRLIKKRDVISKFVNELYEDIKLGSEDHGVVVFGCCQNELNKIEKPYSTMNIYSYPIPLEKLTLFINTKKKIHILEQGDGYGEKLLSPILQKNLNTKHISSETGDVPDLSKSYKEWARLGKLFESIRNINPCCVISEVSQFTVENAHTVGVCLSLGTALPTTHGISKSTKEYPFVVVGDTSLVHGGLSYLEYLKNEKSKMGIIVVDNGGSWCTGGQSTAVNLNFEKYGIPFTEINYQDTKPNELKDLLLEMKQSKKLSILHIKIPMGNSQR